MNFKNLSKNSLSVLLCLSLAQILASTNQVQAFTLDQLQFDNDSLNSLSVSASIVKTGLEDNNHNPISLVSNNQEALNFTCPLNHPSIEQLVVLPSPSPSPSDTSSQALLDPQALPNFQSSPDPQSTLDNNSSEASPSSGLKDPTQSLTPPSPAPSQAPSVSPTPSPIPLPLPSLNADLLFQMIQDYRQKLNLPLFKKEDRLCKLAQERAPEILEEIQSGHMHSGMYDRNLPYWNTENIINMNFEKAAFDWWINDYIHKKQIEGDFKYSCLACYGNSCAEEFSNLTPK